MKLTFSTILVTFIFLTANAQFEPSPVEKSKQLIRYQGVNYYVHTVLKGQTLYRICQTYEVTQEDIARSNPGITLLPLSVGQVLKIPDTTSSPTISLKEDTDTEKFFLHTVQAKENVFYLHKKYNVPLEEIYKYNPGSVEGIRIGQIIRIPKKYSLTAPLYSPLEQPEPVTEYHVRQGDTLYRISQNFNVSINDLIKTNPGLRWGLKADMFLKIPDLKYSQLYAMDSVVSVPTYKGLTRHQCDSLRQMRRSRPPVKAVLMFPFYAKDKYHEIISSSDTLSENGSSRKKVLKGRVAAEIYEGFLLAVDTLQKKGINISLFVYDTEGDTNRVKQILKDLEIVEPDVIIGPFAPDNIELASRFSFEKKIPLVPPLASDGYLFQNNPYLFRVIPTIQTEYETFTGYICQNFSDKNIILAYKKNLKNDAEIESVKDHLYSNLSRYGIADTFSIKEVFINDSLNTEISHALSKDKENLVFIYSSYEPDVINTLSRLHFLMRDYHIEVFGLPAWQKFENIRFDVLHELHTVLYTPFYIDYQREDVKAFVKKCRKTLQYEPYLTTSKGTGINYTFLGYDLGIYFIQSLNNFGDNLCNCTENFETPLLLSNYQFRRNMETGVLENSSINFIQFSKEYTVDTIDFQPIINK
jgi:LysM repeat protein/ABC-type branched-subunit amino acid transport system substrate-binding protein